MPLTRVPRRPGRLDGEFSPQKLTTQKWSHPCAPQPRVHGRRPGGRLGTTGNLEAAEREITHAMLR